MLPIIAAETGRSSIASMPIVSHRKPWVLKGAKSSIRWQWHARQLCALIALERLSNFVL